MTPDCTTSTSTSRRHFLRTSAAAAAGSAWASAWNSPAVLAGPISTQELRVGLVGCGGRGTGAAVNALQADKNAVITALADVFSDRLEASLAMLRKEAPDRVKVKPSRCFVGFDACKKLVASDVDVVLLATPPGFRALHLAAAVEAGKHTFVEITIAVDAPGVRSALASAELARKKNLGILSGFCWRYHFGARAALEQIRAGAIGEVRSIYATYYRGSLSHKYHGPRTPEMTDLVWQLRDWYDYLWLTGDATIVLSGGHSVDKMSWWLGDVMPVKAVAVGSRVRPADGNTFDNCFVAYEYASGIRGFLGCRSIDGCYTENSAYITGSHGTCTLGQRGKPVIQGKTSWRYEGPVNNMHQTEHDEFFASIRAGKPINDGTRMANTTLMAIMGRMAAYSGLEITWEQALNSQDRLVPDEFDWNTKLPPRPLAIRKRNAEPVLT